MTIPMQTAMIKYSVPVAPSTTEREAVRLLRRNRKSILRGFSDRLIATLAGVAHRTDVSA